MRRAAARLAPASRASSTSGGSGRPDLRELKDEHIRLVREGVFGPQGTLPGDRYFRKKLEGRKLMQWYFPSKYNLQDFRVDDYMEMQAERFAPREPHECMPALEGTLQRVAANREKLRSFFGGLDERTFLENPSLQDLYGLFRLVDRDQALPFTPPEFVFQEHEPFYGGAASPFRLTAGGGAERAAEEEEEDAQELSALLSHLKATLPSRDWLALEARVLRCSSVQETRELLAEQARSLGLTPPLRHATCGLEDFGGDRSAAAGAEESASAAEAAGSDSPAGAPSEAASTGQTESAAAGAEESASADDAAGSDGPAGAPSEAASTGQTVGVGAGRRKRLAAYPVQPQLPVSRTARADARTEASKELERIRASGPREMRDFVNKRHRFIDPMFRRRRLKWLERQMTGKNKDKEVKYNSYYATHPDKHTEWPTNKGSVTVVWPSPYH